MNEEPVLPDLPTFQEKQEYRICLVAQTIKNLPAMQETCVQSLGWEDPLKKGTATHPSILTWRIPWTVEFLESQRVGHDWENFAFTFLSKILCRPNKTPLLDKYFQSLIDKKKGLTKMISVWMNIIKYEERGRNQREYQDSPWVRGGGIHWCKH